MASLSAIKATSESRLAEEKRSVDRQRSIIILVLRHLLDRGYVDAADKLAVESGVSLTKWDVADNVDLTLVVTEFEDYFEFRYGRKPRLSRRVTKEDGDTVDAVAAARARRTAAAARVPSSSSAVSSTTSGSGSGSGSVARRGKGAKADGAPAGGAGGGAGGAAGAGADHKDKDEDLASVAVSGAAIGRGAGRPPRPTNDGSDCEDYFENRVLRPPPPFGLNAELRELAAIITRDIYQENPNVRWDDVVELDDAKRLLREAVVMPVKYPALFTGLLSPWRGILLFGPPGTGKTMLARAVATECRTTFFNISASTIVSKWRGDSEKLVRMLFTLARHHAPSTIFLDELDSIMGARGAGEGEHEASRRMKTELLIQMDGLSKSDDLVFVLAASNLPWELDVAMLRRLEKRVMVPLPGLAARRAMIQRKFRDVAVADIDFGAVAARTEGFSGADITLLCKETAMRPVRRLMERLEALDHDSLGGDAPAVLDAVTHADMAAALNVTRASAHLTAEKYEKWHHEFAST